MFIPAFIAMELLSLAPPRIQASQAWLIAIIAADIVVAIIGMVLLASWQKRRSLRRFALELTNQGNVPCSFELRAESPDAALGFDFRMQGRALPIQSYGEMLPEPAPAAGPTWPPAPRPQAQPSKAAEVVGSAMAVSRAGSDVLRTVSMFAPAAARGPLQKAVGGIWRAQATAQRASMLQGQVSRLAGTAGQAQPAVQTPTAVARPRAAAFVATQAWARTPLLQPGEALVVEMLIRFVRSVAGQSYAFIVLSRLADQPDAAVQAERGSVFVGELSWIRRSWPFLLVGTAAIAVLALAFWLASVGALGR